jgi:competence protein ComEC
MVRCRATCLTAFALALWAGLYLPSLPGWRAGLPAAGLALAAAGLAFLGLEAANLRRAGAWLAALGAGLGLAAFSLAPLGAARRLSGLPGESIRYFEGVLAEDSSPASGGAVSYRVRLRTAGTQGLRASASGLVELSVRDGPRLYWGRRVRVLAPVRRAAAQGGARWVSRAAAGELTVLGYASRLLEGRAALHRELERRLGASAPASAGLLSALLLANRAGVPAEEQSLFRDSGSLHLLALSGLHASILFGAAAFLLFWLPDRRWRAAAGAALLLPYLFLAGASPSLSRAVFMLGAGALGFILDRDTRTLNLLSLAAAGILLADPAAAAELSFQLSFIALLGILLLGPWLRRLLTPPLPPPLGSALAMSLAAQAATTPVLLAAFGAAYPAGALASLVLIPLVTVFLWGGLAALLLSLLPFPPLLASPLGLLRGGILAVLGFFARFPALRAEWRPIYWAPIATAFAALLFVKPRALPWMRAPRPSWLPPQAGLPRGSGPAQ